MEMENRVGYRIEVSTSVKGIKTYSATVEVEVDGDPSWATPDEVMTRSGNLIAALDAKYPPQTEGSK